ncbi:HPP family protein [Pseudarthrobacter enclensis]|uniref:HPP family protein n=1 Tax=Pseudarthrobacter enclensis TaxID=993070 RepID=UPI003EE16876
MPGVADLRSGRWGSGVYAGVLSLVVLAACGALGLMLHQPWLFPSLGPTVMLFFESPEQPASRPANALVGHGVGLVAGAALLYAFGLQSVPSAAAGGTDPGTSGGGCTVRGADHAGAHVAADAAPSGRGHHADRQPGHPA